MSEPLKCPVCQARFRKAPVCPRCNTDLSPLMRLAAVAHHLRHRAREALLAGDLPAATQLLSRANTLHRR